MAPLIVLDKKGKFLAAVGSPGGNAILSYNLKAMVGLFYWNLNDAGGHRCRTSSHAATPIPATPKCSARTCWRRSMLAASMIKVGQIEGSGLQGVIVRPGGVLEGGADPRREGVAKGL
jgi:gamma-glutamyltranspeptidase/glutathione hydrolase